MASVRYLDVKVRANTAVFDKNVKKASLLTKSFQKNLTGLAAIAASAFAAQKVVSFFVDSTKAAVEFETQMARVNTMLGGVSPKALESFGRAVEELSVRFGESTTALAQGLYDIVSAGVDAHEAMAVLKVSVKAAKAGMISTAVSADALTTVINAYGLEAEDAALVSDTLFAVVKGGKTTFNELANNIGKVASVASQSGVRLRELGGVIATLTKAGIRTEQAMTQVNAIIAAISKPSKDASAAAKKLGIDFSGAALRTKGLLAVLQQLDGLDPDMINRLFPSIDAIKGIAPLIRDLKGLEDQIRNVGGAVGETDKQLSIMMTTTQQKAALAEQRWESFKRTVGDVSIAVINAIGDIHDAFMPDPHNLLGTTVIGFTDDVTKNISDAESLLEAASALREEITRNIKEGTREAELRARDLLLDYQILESEIRSFLIDDISGGDIDLGTFNSLAHDLRRAADATWMLGHEIDKLESENLAAKFVGVKDKVLDFGNAVIDTAKNINRELGKKPDTLAGVVRKAFKNRLDEVKDVASEIELITGRTITLMSRRQGSFGQLASSQINIRGLAGTQNVEKQSLGELVRIRKAIESQQSAPQLA